MWPMLAGIGGSLLGGAFNYFGQQSTNENQMNMMQMQQAYNTQMSNTAYQRASQDMQAAGLNPMMMFGSGGPASTPQAPPAPQQRSPMETIGSSIQMALNAAVTGKTVDKMSEEIVNLGELRKLLEKQVSTEAERPAQIRAGTSQTEEQAKRLRQEIIKEGPATVEAEGALDNLSHGQMKNIGAIKYLVGSGSDVLGHVLSTATGVGRAYSTLREALKDKGSPLKMSPRETRDLYNKFKEMGLGKDE